MGRQNIFTALSVISVVPSSMRHELVDFLIANRQSIMSPPKASDMFKTRFSGRSPISEIFQRIVMLGKDQSYGLFRLPTKSASLHEVVDMTFIPFDLLQLQEISPSHSKSLSMIPELNDKLIINITDITTTTGEFSNITQFQLRVVRDFLSRSYYSSTGNMWISPTLVRYVAKVYSMTIGGQLARFFGLDPIMRSFIQTLFCLFFVSKMTTPNLAQSFIKAHAKQLNLYDSQDLAQIFAFVQDTLNKPAPDSLEDVFAVIDAYGSPQLRTEKASRLDRTVVNQKFASLHPEGRMSMIALEYPPYFLFLMLLALSNNRIGLTFHMKNLNLMKEGTEVIDQMIKSPLFTQGL